MSRVVSSFNLEAPVERRPRLSSTSSLASDGAQRRTSFIGAPKAGQPWRKIWFAGLVNCVNTIIGAGTLAVPKAIHVSGYAFYHFMVLVVLLLTYVSLLWLIAVTDALPGHVPRNYESVAEYFLGPQASTAFSAAMLFGGFALTMGYMLLIATTLGPVVVDFWNDVLEPSIFASSYAKISDRSAERFVLFSVGLFIVLPLGLLRDISKLKYTSAFGIMAMMYAAIYVLVTGCYKILYDGISPSIAPFPDSMEVFEGLAMTVSAFSCHISTMPVYETLGEHQSENAMISIVMAALFTSFIFYEIVGLSGYLAFGSGVASNVLQSFSNVEMQGNMPWLIVARLGVSITLICSVPIIIWPLRSCIISEYQKLVLRTPLSEPSGAQWTLTTTVVMLMVLGFAVIFPDVKTALSVVGSIGGSFIVFMFPSAFYLSVVKRVNFRHWLQGAHMPQVAMISAGVVIGIVCLSVSVSNAIQKMSGPKAAS